MKATEVVREIMKLSGVTLATLASRANKSSRLISDRLSQGNISVDKLNEMFRALDYKLIAVPRSAVLPKDSYEVE